MHSDEILNEEGYRMDGRKPNEFRSTKIHLGDFTPTNEKDGFAYMEIGNTKTLAYVRGPVDTRRNNEKCTIKCEVVLSPFSIHEKKKTKSQDMLTQEIGIYVKKICEYVIMCDNYKNADIHIYIYVLERDGGIKYTVVNTCFLALINAGIYMKFFLAASSALYWQNNILVDPNQLEINSGAQELTVVLDMTTQKIVALDYDSEIAIDEFDNLIQNAIQASFHIGNIMKLYVKESAIQIYTLNQIVFSK